ncbi:MAG: SH3 domain-containing protein [Sulfurimonas sp.]
MNYIYLVVLGIVLSACSHTPTASQINKKMPLEEKVQDLETIPQDPSYYSADIKAQYLGEIEEFAKHYFRVWDIAQISVTKEEASWAYVYDNNNSYTYTLQTIDDDFFEQLKQESNLEKFATLNQQGVSLRLLDLRALPTDKPIFLDPAKAGEGYPFDYLQNSSLAANKPILISHYSKDKKWAFIECSFGFGWVKSKDIVTIAPHYTAQWKEAEQIFFTKENQPVYDQQGNFLFYSRVGMVLPLIQEDKNSFTVLAIGKTEDGTARFLHSKISKDIAHKGVLQFNSANVTQVMGELQKGRYGWGGIYGQRDCSSTLRDLFTPFGVWLPRNSSVQSSVGSVVDLEELQPEDKLAKIQQEAIPFQTLLYKQGHIGLYVGDFENQVIMFQNVWGVKTKKDNIEGRFLISGPIFSTLEVGKNLSDYDPEASMLYKLKSINILTP